MSGEGNKKDEVRWGVFLPAFLIIGGGALLGILKNDWLTKMCSAIFGWSLKSFGWLPARRHILSCRRNYYHIF